MRKQVIIDNFEIPPFEEPKNLINGEFIIKILRKNGKITAPWLTKYYKISSEKSRRLLRSLEENGILTHEVRQIQTDVNGTRVKIYRLKK
jgi:predicted HTH transcriptional regulator